MKTVFVFLAVWFGVIGTAFSQYFDSPPGPPIYGPPLTNESLFGKVVYVEYWGIHCGPCRAAFPHLVEAQATFGRTGSFVLIGSHLQEMSPEVVEFLRGVNCNFTNYQQYRCPLAPPQDGGIPQAYLLDCRGRLVAGGHPKEVLGKIAPYVEEAVQRRMLMQGFNPAMIVDLPEKFQNAASLFASDKAWGAPLKQLEKKAKKDDEAKAALEAIQTAIETEIDSLVDKRKQEPIEVLFQTMKLKKNLKGHPLSEKLEKLEKYVKKADGAEEMQKLWLQIQNFQKKCNEGKVKPDAALKEAKRLIKRLRDEAENDKFHKIVRQELAAKADKLENQIQPNEAE